MGDVGVKVLADGLGLNSMALTLSLAGAAEGLAISREAGPVGGERTSGGGIGVGICMLAVGALYCWAGLGGMPCDMPGPRGGTFWFWREF